MPSAELTNDVPLQYDWDVPAMQKEIGTIRIPSPLLYHRRSQGVSTEPLVEPLLTHKQPDAGPDKYNSKYTRLMSEIRAAGQEKQTAEPSSSTFVAARLPLMGEALSADQSEDGGVSLQDISAVAASSDELRSKASYLPPILTTTNTYIFPKRVYHVVCQPNPAWSGPAYSNINQSWGWDQNLVFPKLAVPGHNGQPLSRSSSSGNSDQGMILRSTQGVKYANLTTSMPTSKPALQESRVRSSTQDSFDSKFDVATARKLDLPTLVDSMSAEAKVQGWDTISPGAPIAVVASEALNRGAQLTCDTNTAADDEFPEGAKPIGKMVDWLFDELDSECLLHSEKEQGRDDHFAVTAVRNEDILAKIDASEAEDKVNEVWFDYHAPIEAAGVEAGSDGEQVDAVDAEADDADWAWDNDEWESVESTPTTDCDEPVGLFATEWEQ
ncbi:hypothetical protein OHC33_003651 [Knufia fluminis]|uniref:Uncharacterized protein n=1 Tax=Knufia fluminis TaxID=191047 RepID=A0AAN8ENG4_9EURO|nr:hypothetical protein OHC33_003651 [Knufia fluminis]